MRAGGCKKFASELAYCWRQHSEMSMMMAEVPISRPTPPRLEDYVVVPGSQGPRRDFRIASACARAGTLRGACSTCPRLCALLAPGGACRVRPARPSGMFTRAEVTRAWPRDDGTVGSDREPVALFTGEAVRAYLGHLSDAAIEAMLNELATQLGAALGQERI